MAQEASLTLPKISIIVPVYKVEQYLCRCLNSIVAQTFTDWECILIDDGSPDNSGAICDEYAAKDNRFLVIHQENAGVSAARNAGLDAAKGEWITFVDSDDWIEPIAYEEIFSFASKNDCDVLITGYSLFDGKTDFAVFLPKNGVLRIPEDIANWQGPCAKLFKTTILHKVRFPKDITIAEDLYFTFQIYFSSAKIYGYDKNYYHYFQNPKSAMHSINNENINDEIYVINYLEFLFIKNNADLKWYEVLKEKKAFAKNKWIFNFSVPQCERWRSCYPEVTNYIIKNSSSLKKILFFLLLRKYDRCVHFLLKIHKYKKLILGE